MHISSCFIPLNTLQLQRTNCWGLFRQTAKGTVFVQQFYHLPTTHKQGHASAQAVPIWQKLNDMSSESTQLLRRSGILSVKAND